LDCFIPARLFLRVRLTPAALRWLTLSPASPQRGLRHFIYFINLNIEHYVPSLRLAVERVTKRSDGRVSKLCGG
jgi:hypothetical protein